MNRVVVFFNSKPMSSTAVNIEPHAFGNYVPVGAETLVIGTFPTHKRNWKFEFFYPNSSNIFWRLVGDLFNHTFIHNSGEEAVHERKAVAALYKFALTDMLAKAIRQKDNSGDDQLVKIELMDIFGIINQCPTIHRLILTSRSGKINALGLFEEYLKSKGISFYQGKIGNLIVGFFEFNQRRINVFVPYSPSPRVERQHGYELIKEMYQKCFEN